MLAALCTALAACGGHAPGTSTRASLASGRVLFSRACGACHTLSGHDDPRHQGGDLRGFHASRAQMRQLAAEMPVRRPLTAAQLQSVVAFVISVEARR